MSRMGIVRRRGILHLVGVCGYGERIEERNLSVL